MLGHRNLLAAGILVLGFAGASAAQQAVVWTGPANVSVRGNAIQKTGGCDGCDDAGALSRQVIRSGDGSVEFTVDDAYAFWAAGLSRSGEQPRVDQIDFAWRFNGDGWADVIEDGAYRENSDTEAKDGDVFRVAVVNGRVQYIKNDDVVLESSRRPRYPLAFVAALGTAGTRVANARIDTSGQAVVGTAGRDRSSSNDAAAFRDLDRNGNGLLTRAEFDGTASEFDRIDVNRDGRLNRAEWTQAAPSSSSSTADSPSDDGDYEVFVDARQQWTDTGVWVEAGDVITFVADGTVNLNQTGATSAPAGSPHSTQNPPLRNAPVGILIARVGNAQILSVGERRTLRAPASGQLFLGVNDDVLSDNSGEYRVAVTVRQR